MKKFIIDRLVDRENLCNLKNETSQINNLIEKKADIVIYAPRNYGKTSLVKNIIIDDFKNQHKKGFVFFADLYGVKDMNGLINRIMRAFEISFAESFPIENTLKQIKTLFSNLRPEMSFDPITGAPNFSLGILPNHKEYSLDYLFQLMQEIAKKTPTLIVIDEFQDIIFVNEAQALLRTIFQEIQNIPIILLGSKRHILNNIFSNPEAPLAAWGVDVEIPPIPYKEYQEYMNERFSPFELKINLEEATSLQDLLYRVPESINIVCQQIIDQNFQGLITQDIIRSALKSVLDLRSRRYETQLSNCSKAEESLLIALAKLSKIAKPQSKLFVEKTKITNRSIAKIIQKMMDHGVIEKVEGFYRISNPLLSYYLEVYR